MNQASLEALRQVVRAVAQEALETLPMEGTEAARFGSIWRDIKKEVTNALAEVALDAHHGNQSKAACSLGINRNTLREWLKQGYTA